METIKNLLNETYTILQSIPVNGDSVYRMAAAMTRVREAYQLCEKEPERESEEEKV